MTFKPNTPPVGCHNAEEIERQLVSLASTLRDRAQRLLERDGRIDVATGNQLALAAIRCLTAAADLATRREDIEHADYLLAESRKLAGVGHVARDPNRPRLHLAKRDAS